MQKYIHKLSYYIEYVMPVILALACFINIRLCNIFIAFFFLKTLSQSYASGRIKQDIIETVKLKFFDPKNKRQITELVILSGFAVFASPNASFSLRSFITIIIFLLLLLYTYKLGNIVNKLYFRRIFLASFILLLLGFCMYYAIGGFHEISGKCLGILCTIPFAISYFKDELLHKPKHKFMLITILYIGIGYVIFHNHSATSKFAFMLVPVVYLMVRILPVNITRISIISFAILMGIAFPIVVHFSNTEDIFAKIKMPPSFKHRVCILKYSMEKFIENPISGNGFKASRFYESNKDCFIVTKEERQEILEEMHPDQKFNITEDAPIKYAAGFHPHNFIVQILFELGVFGMLLFFNIVYSVTAKINKDMRRQYLAVNITILSVFITLYIFSYSLWETWIMSYMFCLIYVIKFLKEDDCTASTS